MEKLNKLSELIKNGSTFSGLDIEIDVKNQNDVRFFNKDGLNMLENSNDLFTQFKNNHTARGVKIENVSSEDLLLLKEIFGPLCGSTLNDIKKNDVTILTHIEKKTGLEKTVEATFNLTGGALATPGAILAMAGERIIEGGVVPITLAVMGAGVTVPAAIITAVSLGVGSAVSLVPKLADKIIDKFNGDEREIAIEMATKILTNQDKLSNMPNIKEVMDKVKSFRQDEPVNSKKKTI